MAWMALPCLCRDLKKLKMKNQVCLCSPSHGILERRGVLPEAEKDMLVKRYEIQFL